MSLVHASALAVFELRGDIPAFEGEFWLAAYQEQIRSIRQLTRGLERESRGEPVLLGAVAHSVTSWLARIEAHAHAFHWKAWHIVSESWMHDLADLTVTGVTQEDWQHFLDAWCRRRACDWEPLADGEPCFEQGDIEQLPTCQNCAVLVDMATICGQERKSVL